MYVKRIQLHNYGPVERLDIELPFNGETPLPVVLVGENGSGKSILLSHIVNGLLAAKGVAFPGTPEIENDKVYKLRSRSYIKSGSEYYFGRVDFEGSLFVSELWTHREKQGYSDTPEGVKGTDAHAFWEKLSPQDNNKFDTNIIRNANTSKKIEELFDKNCVLYLPHNRFEEPAWLNEENLKAQAQYMDLKHLQGHSERKVIASSPLRDNQNWLFDTAYDSSVFEARYRQYHVNFSDGRGPVPTTVFQGHSGRSTSTYKMSKQVLRIITRRSDVRFGIGRRHNRLVSIVSDVGSNVRALVSNIFQLSSGETSLLNLFLSILRDFDLCGAPFSRMAEVRGIVVVDEIDLHLHATHQYEVLPNLIKMFPKVQFIVTTHSPLFVLGMQKAFGEDGFGLYRLPRGQQISPEEFGKFGEAYQALTATRTFNDDVRAAIENSQKPIVFVEGKTGKKYLQRAAQLLGQESILQQVDVKNGGGDKDLTNIWKHFKAPLPSIIPQRVFLLYDCELRVEASKKGNLFRQSIPPLRDNPLSKGIENLFAKPTLEKAIQQKPAFIDIDPGRTKTVRGEHIAVPEEWSINENEKTNLCDWLCTNGTAEDFQSFALVLIFVKETLGIQAEVPSSTRAIEKLSNGVHINAEEVENLEQS